MKKSYRSILSIGLLSVLLVSLVFMLTGCGLVASSPTARITQDPEGTLDVGDEVTFDGDNSDPSDKNDGEIISYDWTFPDDFSLGSTPDKKVQTGSFDAAGTYTVTLTVTDDDYKPDTATVDVEVE